MIRVLCFLFVSFAASACHAQGSSGGTGHGGTGLCLKVIPTTCEEEFGDLVTTCSGHMECSQQNGVWNCYPIEPLPNPDPESPLPPLQTPFELFESQRQQAYNKIVEAGPLELGYLSFQETQLVNPCGGWRFCKCDDQNTGCVNEDAFWDFIRPYDYNPESSSWCIGE
jgi:hypothetical protein